MNLSVLIEGSGYPILCLHGHPGRGSSMGVFTRHLTRQGFKTIAPDLRGYGSSQTSESFEMQDHLLDLEALVDRLQLEQFLLLGWSLGGILAMELALKMPQRVSGMILVATAARPFGSHPPVSWVDDATTGIAAILNWLKPGWEWNIETFGKRSLFRYLIQRHTPEAYRFLADEAIGAYLQTSKPANQALNAALRKAYSRLDQLEQIRCPALMLCGAEDRHITANSSRETANRLPNCRFHCYEQTAHLFPWEIPQRILEDIDRWMEEEWQTGQASRS